jgi:endonuclease III
LDQEHIAYAQAKYPPIAQALATTYGRKVWRGHLDGMDELISCVLSQNTNDANRDRGFSALKKRFPTWEAAHHAAEDEIIDTIRPAGLANQKGPRIQKILGRIFDEQGAYNIDFLRELAIDDAKKWLVDLPGVGPKTAAIVLCFAYNLPAFPVDTHVHRVGKRIGFLPQKISADKAHPMMEAIVPPKDYYSFHLQMIYHGRALCKARNPLCEQCPIQAHCDYYASLPEQAE